MSTISESQLSKMTVREVFQCRRQCAENRDIESLLTIVRYRFLNGSIETNIDNLPEMCYYYGRLRRVEELEEFLNEKPHYLFGLPESCKELAQNLLNIGCKFPFLNDSEISYLEERYSDSKTFEFFDIIMFDSDRLPRPLKKFDKESLNRCNTDFSRDFLLQIYKYFSKNEELNDGYEPLYVYSRIENRIIRKDYENIGLGECVLTQLIISDKFWNLIQELYGDECADYFAKHLSFKEDVKGFKNGDYILNAKSIANIAKKYFNNLSKVADMKVELALFWLRTVNSKKINLI